jgi:hypothetical protein
VLGLLFVLSQFEEGDTMGIRLVAIDLDDTLLDSGLRISPRCVSDIENIRQQGILVTLATGRMYRSALPFALKLGMNIPLITYQGALVKDTYSQEVLYFRPVGELAPTVMEFLREQGVYFHTYFDDQLCVESDSPEAIAYSQLAGVELTFMPDLIKASRSLPAFKIMAISNQTSSLDPIEADLRERFGQELFITRSKLHYLEIMHRDANKARALQLVAEHYGIKQADVLAIGDSYNDVGMLAWAGTGIAVGNAPPLVKEAADHVTASNDEDGVAEALEKWVLHTEPGPAAQRQA